MTAASLHSVEDWAALSRAVAGECIEIDAPCATPAVTGHIYCVRHARKHVREYRTPAPTLAEHRADLERLDRETGVRP